MSRAADKAFEVFGADLKDFMSAALSNSLKYAIGDLDREIVSTVKKVFWYPGDPSRLTQKRFSTKGVKFSSASLSYRFEAVSLSKYPMKQVRVTKGGRRLKVTRFSGRGRFTEALTPQVATMTQFKLRKSEGWQTVQGRRGYKYKGFLHTGKRGGFSSAVFERSQQATWSGGMRLPIHKLYGASLVRLLRSHELQTLFQETKVFSTFEKRYRQAMAQNRRF